VVAVLSQQVDRHGLDKLCLQPYSTRGCCLSMRFNQLYGSLPGGISTHSQL